MKKQYPLLLMGAVVVVGTALFMSKRNEPSIEKDIKMVNEVDKTKMDKQDTKKKMKSFVPISSQKDQSSNKDDLQIEKKDESFSVRGQIKHSISFYMNAIQNYTKRKMAKEVFEDIYASKEKHKYILDLISDFSKVNDEFSDGQAKARVFAVSYVSYIYKEKNNQDELIEVLNSISEDINKNGNIKNRSLDLEDLLVSYFSKISFQQLKQNPNYYFSKLSLNSSVDKFVRNSLLASYSEIDDNPLAYKKIVAAMRNLI
ncbi:MAG: hypothetical protein KDD50_00810 [Bdellovibrionales bacterium]|nr:hypothetical protein [Bdellovibrionales bacterium]